MKTISQEAIREILRIYALEQDHQEYRQAIEDSGKEQGWLGAVSRDVRVLTDARTFIQSFGDERSFIFSLAEYLINNNLVPKPIKKKKGSSEPDFIDQLQERVV